MNRYKDRTVIVTGAGGGIGRASALRLASEGARVVCMDIADTRGETARLASEAGKSAGGSAFPAHLDITDPEGVKSNELLEVQFTISWHNVDYMKEDYQLKYPVAI